MLFNDSLLTIWQWLTLGTTMYTNVDSNWLAARYATLEFASIFNLQTLLSCANVLPSLYNLKSFGNYMAVKYYTSSLFHYFSKLGLKDGE